MHPVSIAPLEKNLAIGRIVLADFETIGPILGQVWIFNFCLDFCCANLGPTVDFYSRLWKAIIGDVGKLRKGYLF